jgi:uncharacterized OB-fold protein/acyl dehydratase
MSEERENTGEAVDLMEKLNAFVGNKDGGIRSCPYPVNDAMIHHWCDAIGDRNPSYLDHDFAESSLHGGIVAPPTMLQAWTMPGLRPPASTDPADAQAPSVLQVLDEAGFTSVVATNCEQEYFRYLKPGDRLTHDVEIESVSDEKKTGLGVGHFVTQLYNYRDEHGELVGQMRFRLLKFRPASDKGRPIVGPRIPGGRPRPSLNRDVAFFWEGAARGELLVQSCMDCQALRHPPGPGCPECASMEWEPTRMSGSGEIYSFVRHHHPAIAPFETGHPVVLVQLDEGPRLVSELTTPDAGRDDIAIGMRVEVQFDEVEEGFTMPRFRIVAPDKTTGTE